jgi:myosin-crossreactive antigen
MKAHIVGGGFGGLAAAGYLIRNAGVSGQDITIYDADERMGGGFFLGGSAESGYNLPGSVFDNEFRCAFDLLDTVPSALTPGDGRLRCWPRLATSREKCRRIPGRLPRAAPPASARA